jgi:hypothetical protein
MENKQKNQGLEILPSFPNRRSAVKSLQEAGYQISDAQFYRHCEKGMVRVNPDGSVLESEIRGYTANLKRIVGDIEDLNNIHSLKTKKEVEKLELQNAKLKFDQEKEQGKYIPRVDLYSELASRAAVLDTGFRHMFNVHAREWIALVGGQFDKSADFLQALNHALDEQLNTYANIKTFHVLFVDDDSIDEINN